MTKTTNTIDINGKRYDTLTGRLLSDVQPRYARVAGGSVDGFVATPPRPAAAAPAARSMHRPSLAAPAAHVAGPHKAFDVNRPTAHAVAHRKPQHSTTLMRKSVSKPAASLKRVVKITPSTATLIQKPHFDVTPKPSVARVDEHRLKHAHAVPLSRSVSRFGTVQPPRAATRRPITTPITPRSTSPAPVSARSPQPSTDVFERALAAANSHQQPHVKAHPKGGRKSHTIRNVTSIAASSLAILLIVGFVAYLNEASLQMRLASSRAGISATLPRWRPAGFSVCSFSYAPNTVTVSFKGDDPARSFSLTQSASNWDSSALLSDYVLPHADTYNTVQSEGNTIYTFGNNSATWVSGGIWYQLTTNGNLSTSQIVELAASM